ncbi:MAG: hypothetical protein KAR47_12725, partial [Planctomycetes bacterium]|nr:hypothetical protein [Planctomycetota bacterium]
DDDEFLRDAMSVILRNARFQCRGFGNAEDFFQSLTMRNCDLLLTDLRICPANSCLGPDIGAGEVWGRGSCRTESG